MKLDENCFSFSFFFPPNKLVEEYLRHLDNILALETLIQLPHKHM